MFDKCKRVFVNHVGTIVQNTEEFFIADYQDAKGSLDYYVSYVVDKRHGTLMITGDIGTCIATLGSMMSPDKMNSLFHSSVEYFISKIQCATDMFVDDFEDVVEAIKTHTHSFSSTYDEFIREEVQTGWEGAHFVPTTELLEFIRNRDATYEEWLPSCGRHIAPRVYMWLYGFNEVCKLIT